MAPSPACGQGKVLSPAMAIGVLIAAVDFSTSALAKPPTLDIQQDTAPPSDGTPPSTIYALPIVKDSQPPGSPAPPGPAPQRVIAAVWTSWITSAELGYPQAAVDMHVRGKVQLECTILDDVGHAKCAIISEEPTGYGFGDEAARNIETKKRAARGIPIGTVMRTPKMLMEYPGS